MRCQLLLVAAGLAVGCGARPQDGAVSVRPYDVTRHPRRWDGEGVVVDVYEEIEADPRDRDEPQLYVPGPHGRGLMLSFSPDASAALRRYEWGMRMHGNVVRHGRLAELQVQSIEPAPEPAVLAVEDTRAIRRRPRFHYGKYIELEGVQRDGFELSSFAGMWLSFGGETTVRCPAVPLSDEREGVRSNRARVRGFVYTLGHYGHLGAWRTELVAREVVHLPECPPEPEPLVP